MADKNKAISPYFDGDNLSEGDLLVTLQATYIVLGENETQVFLKDGRNRRTSIFKVQLLEQNPVLVKKTEVLKYQLTPAERAKKTKK